MLPNYAHEFDFFVQWAGEFEAMCSNRKSYAEEPRLIGVDEITCMPFVWGYRQIRFVHVCMHINRFSLSAHVHGHAQFRPHIGAIYPRRAPIGFLRAHHRSKPIIAIMPIM
jgi:hypothetical protein